MRLRGRAYTRYQRKRMIRRRMPLYPWVDKPGKLAKHSYRYRCTCEWCAETRHAHIRRRWKRAAWREIEPVWSNHQEYMRQMRWSSVLARGLGPRWLAQAQQELQNELLDYGPSREAEFTMTQPPVRAAIMLRRQ